MDSTVIISHKNGTFKSYENVYNVILNPEHLVIITKTTEKNSTEEPSLIINHDLIELSKISNYQLITKTVKYD